MNYNNTDAIAIFEYPDLTYFSGYDNADAVILLTPAKKYYVTDSRQYAEVKELLPDFEVVKSDRNGYNAAFAELLKTLNIGSLGYRNDRISLVNYRFLEGLSLPLSDASAELNAVRAVKTEAELQKIRKAQSITDGAFAAVLGEIKEGMTERELSAILDSTMYRMGADGLAFPSIVAFAENAAKPHAHKSDRKLKHGDAVLMDFGAKYDNYCSDMTRSFAFGKLPEGYKAHYEAVLEAQKRALAVVAAGKTGVECDEAARGHLARLGLAEYFTHSLGHSLGVEIHEQPSLNAKNPHPLPAGVVVSVEPGLYFDGLYGIRIEDIVLIKENGNINLTKSDKKLIIV